MQILKQPSNRRWVTWLSLGCLAALIFAEIATLVSMPQPAQATPQPVKLELGGEGASGWAITNIAPSNSGSKNVVLSNTGTDAGYVVIWITDVADTEGTPAGVTTGHDTAMGQLSRHLQISTSGVLLQTNISFPTTLSSFPQSAIAPDFVLIGPLPAGGSTDLRWDWSLPASTGNDVQGDSVAFRIHYMMVQPPWPPPQPGRTGTPPPLPPPPAPTPPAPAPLQIEVSGTTVQFDRTSAGATSAAQTISFADNKVAMTLARNTYVAGPGNVTPDRLAFSESKESPPTPAGTKLVSPVYDFTGYLGDQPLESIRFDPPLTLVVSYNVNDVPQDVASLAVAYYDKDQGWVQLGPPEGFVAGEGKVAAVVSHFTPFAVLAIAKPPAPIPARFDLRNLAVSSARVKPGDMVTITVDVANRGELSGEYAVKVSVQSLLQTQRVVNLTPGTSRQISFTVTAGEPGTYLVQIGNLQTRFTVVAPQASALPLFTQGSYIWLALDVFIIALIAALAILRRPRNRPISKQ